METCWFVAEMKAGVSSAGGGYEEDVAADIEGDVAECRTRLTSFWASDDQTSTVRTKYEVSMSLSDMIN